MLPSAISMITRPNRSILFLSYLEPHFQNRRDHYPAPSGYEERYTGRWLPPDLAALGGTSHQHMGGYYGMVKRLDEALGRLFDTLKSLESWKIRSWSLPPIMATILKPATPNINAPAMKARSASPAPSVGPASRVAGQVQQLTNLLDLPPTLLEAAGIPVPAAMQGHSILPLVNHQKVDWDQEIFIQISESQVGRAIRTHRWKYSVTAENLSGSAANLDPVDIRKNICMIWMRIRMSWPTWLAFLRTGN